MIANKILIGFGAIISVAFISSITIMKRKTIYGSLELDRILNNKNKQ